MPEGDKDTLLLVRSSVNLVIKLMGSFKNNPEVYLIFIEFIVMMLINKSNNFQVYNFIKHHLHILVCIHHPVSMRVLFVFCLTPPFFSVPQLPLPSDRCQ